MARRITVETLEAAGACAAQLARFAKRWPNGVVPTKRHAAAFVRIGLDARWVAERLLTPDLMEEYKERRAPLWEAFLQQLDVVWGEYLDALAEAPDSTWLQQQPLLLDEYGRRRDALWLEYAIEQALLFVEMWRRMPEEGAQ